MLIASARLILLLALVTTSLFAEDWTVDGKTYHNVVVGQIEPDRVHITYDGGLGTVALADLPPDLQKRFNYNAAQAKTAADARAQHDAATDAMAEAERAKESAAESKAALPPTVPAKTDVASRVAQLRAKLTALENDLAAKRAAVAAHHYGMDAATSPGSMHEEQREIAALQNEMYALDPSTRPTMPAPLPVSERANVLDPYTPGPQQITNLHEAGGG